MLADLLQAKTDKENVFWRDNAETVQEYENDNWRFSREFSVDEIPGQAVLVCERLDTYCDIYLNGQHVGSADNGFIPHRFALDAARGLLHKGQNRIEIYFYSPISRVQGKRPLSGAFTTERLNTRRMQCTYGWDWTMRFVTCGIGADIYIETVDSSLAVQDVYIYTKDIDADSAALGVDCALVNAEKGEVLTFEILDPEGNTVCTREKYCAEPNVHLDFDVPSPLLWFPNGYGDQPLYTFTVRSDRKELSRTVFGIRTVKILQLPDRQGSENYIKCQKLKETPFSKEYDKNTIFSGFILKINGVRISCKGADWVPCEPFVTAGTDRKITEILELAKDAGVNMIRVWGGGQFESEHFYNECSLLGIAVTQDFLMACGRYPEDDASFLEQLTEEAEYAAVLLRNQACLVWWSGDNENAVNGCDTDPDYPGRRSALRAIEPVLRRKDPMRAFLPSSPYGGKNYASNTVGTTHNSQYLSYFFDHIAHEPFDDYKDYFKQYNARFIAEEPTMGAVSKVSLRKMMSETDIFGEDIAMWKYHMKSNPGLQKHLFDYLCDFSQKILGEFTDGADRLFKLEYAQYEWVRVTLERMRREKWFCSGILYWMLNDCWAASAGWSLIDYYVLPKSAYYSFKRTAKPLIVSVDREDGCCRFCVCNDSLNSRRVTLRCLRITIPDGSVTEVFTEHALDIPANTSVFVAQDRKVSSSVSAVILAELSDQAGVIDYAFYKEGALRLVPCRAGDYTVETLSESELRITANSYIHVLHLTSDAVFSDNDFLLPPGVTRTVTMRQHGAAPLQAPEISAYTLKA